MLAPLWLSISEAVKNYAEMLAILVGSGWALGTFCLRREKETALDIALACRCIPDTPKTVQIDELFLKALGIPRMSDNWRWKPTMTADRARTKLDKYVTLRGAIAHRGTDLESVKKAQVKDYFEFIRRLAEKTGSAVGSLARRMTGKSPW